MCQSTHMQQQQQQPTPSTSGGEDPSWREQGNAAFKDGQRGVPGAYLRAAALYTRAIKEEPTNAVLYSNRAAALLQINKVSKALADAEECTRLLPEWEKGHFRKAACLEALERWEEALAAYQAAAECSKDSKQVAEKVRLLTRRLQKQKATTQQPAAAVMQETGISEGSSGKRSCFKF